MLTAHSGVHKAQRGEPAACPTDMQREGVIYSVVKPVEGRGQSELADIYVRWAPSGMRLAYLLTGDRQVAEDLVQDAFVKFGSRLQRLRDRHAAEAYLRRTVVNLSKNRFRRRAVERAYLEREGGRRQPEHIEPDVSTHQAMRGALMALPARQRAAIVLRYYEDLPENEIAEILECRPATVRSLVARGLHTLRGMPEVSHD